MLTFLADVSNVASNATAGAHSICLSTCATVMTWVVRTQVNYKYNRIVEARNFVLYNNYSFPCQLII